MNPGRRAFVCGAAALTCMAAARSETAMTLRVSATPSVFRPMFEALRREFERRNPGVRVELTATARDQDQQIQDTLRRALVDHLPDVSFEGMRFLRALQRRRIAVPLNSWISREPEWTASYGTSVTTSTRVGPAVLGLGAAVSVPIIYYNADAVAASTHSQMLPADWTGLLALIEELGRTAPRGTLGGFIQHASSSLGYFALVESLGGSMMNDAESKLTFDDAAGKRALEIHAAFGRAGQARMDMDREQARQAFAAGAIALLIDSSSSLAMLSKQIGTRYQLGTARLPIVSGGRIPVGGVSTVLMAKDSTRHALAWEFMKFVSGFAGQQIVGKSTGYLPANDWVIRRGDLLANHYEAQPLTRAIVDSMPFATRWYAFPGNNSAKIDDVLVDGVSSVVSLSRTPDQALTRMRRTIEAMLPEQLS